MKRERSGLPYLKVSEHLIDINRGNLCVIFASYLWIICLQNKFMMTVTLVSLQTQKIS